MESRSNQPGWLAGTNGRRSTEVEPLAGISWLEMRTYMTSTLLRDTDAVSMRNRWKSACPPRHVVVEFVARCRMQRAAAPCAESLPGGGAWRFAATGDSCAEQTTFTLPWEEWLREPLRARMEASFAVLSRRWLLTFARRRALGVGGFLAGKPAGRVPGLYTS